MAENVKGQSAAWYRSRTLLFLVGLVGGLGISVSVMNTRLRASEAELLAAYRRPIKTDTVVVHKVYRDTVTIVERTRPKTVYIYQQPDTARRQRLERDTLIGGIRLDSKRLEVELLTPKGVSVIEHYPLPSSGPVHLEIAKEGTLELQPDREYEKGQKRKKRLNRIGIFTTLLVGLTVGLSLR